MSAKPLILISGFSGAGKTTFWKELIAKHPDQIIRVPTTTSRPPREGDTPGVDYHFVTPEEFLRKKEAGEFLETSYHFGTHYGSTHPEKFNLAPGQIPLYTVDPNGVNAIKALYPDAHAFFLFISPEEQYKRLLARGTAPDLIQKRIDRYNEEAQLLENNRHLYHVLRNEEPDDLAKAIEYFKRTVQLG